MTDKPFYFDCAYRSTKGAVSFMIDELTAGGVDDDEIANCLASRFHYMVGFKSVLDWFAVVSDYRARCAEGFAVDFFDCRFSSVCKKLSRKKSEHYFICCSCRHHANCSICVNNGSSVCDSCSHQ